MADSASNSCRKMYVGPFGLPFPKKLYYTGGGDICIRGRGGRVENKVICCACVP